MAEETQIRASQLQLGDEIKLYKPEPAEPLTRFPWSGDVWWTVASLLGNATVNVTGIGGIIHAEPAIVAEVVREVTRQELGLDVEAWAKMIDRMGLNAGTEKIRLTERRTFIVHHRLTVRRAEMDQEARDLEERVRHAS